MKIFQPIILIIFCLHIYSVTYAGGDGIVKERKKVFVVSIGFDGKDWNPSKELAQLGYANCPVCANDVNVFTNYFLSVSKNKNSYDTVITYSFPKSISLDSLYGLFRTLEQKITSKDLFVFYYSSGGWGLNVNPISNKEESYYVLSNQLQNKQDIYKYAFTLQTLKQLTDKLPNKNQLIVFDTGLGSVIQNDFANNFFSSNIAEASFTQKNRIIICPENFSAETTDKKDDTRKGDLVRIITSVPEQFNILNLFVDSVQREHTNNTYKKTMQYLWEQQACCVTTLKIIREKEYFTYLTAFNNNIALSTRSSLKPSAKKTQADSLITNKKLKAIIIATNNYEAKNTWANLKTPVNDGVQVASILKSMYGYDTTILYNPTKEEILKVLDAITVEDVVNPYSQYIVYFAGHGYWADKRGGYIVTSNSKDIRNIAAPLSAELSSYLSYAELLNSLGLLNKVILITDVCFGGTSFNSIIPRNAEVNPQNEKTKVINPYKKILASGVKEVDDFVRLHNGSISKHSQFAQNLINVLSNKNAMLSFEKLFALLKETQKEPTPVSKDFGEITEPNQFNL